MSGNFTRLIETPLILTPPVERNGDDTIDVPEQLACALAHSLSERACQRVSPRIFERMNNFSERSVVVASRAGPRHSLGVTATA